MPENAEAAVRVLKENGIEVETGVLKDEAMALNKRFFVSNAKLRPYIILKWAQTKDRFIARNNYDSKWISNEYSRQLVHKWRTEEDAILVGKNTVEYDDPQLTVRDWQGSNPIRVIVDPDLKLKSSSKVFNGHEKVFVFNLKENSSDKNITRVKANRENFLADLLKELYQQDIGSVIVEGGAKTINSFIAASFWDEARVFTSENSFGSGIAAPALKFDKFEEQTIIGDLLQITNNPKSEKLWQKN